jgi:serine/threonine protein kinase/putative intracellular protease/amidase
VPQRQPAHPTAEQLRAFGLGQLGPGESAEVERHVEHCDDCCQALQSIPDDTVMVKLKQCHTVVSRADEPDPQLERDSDQGGIPVALQEHPRYRVLKVLGRGGMGVVYKAEHRLMERPVALKVISRRLIANPLAVERFQREVKLAARLTHPNIVVAHDAEQAGDLHFLVMEYVDGISLAQFVERKGPLPAPLASHFIRQAALGLQAAAKLGMVHRDIKPQNLMLTRKPEVKILDFGLARFAAEESTAEVAPRGQHGSVDSAEHGGLTSAGMILGTPDYIAPEQAEDSSQADTRADIYSLGCTFFFLLTGQAPFAGDSVTRTLQSHIDRQPPSLRSLRPDLAPELVRIVERMMAKDPDQRFQTAGEVIKTLVPLTPDQLAAFQQWDSITVHRPASARDTPATTEIDEPPTTLELVRRRHWKTLWTRARYETRKFFRLPHRRVAASVLGLVLLVAGVAGLMEWSHRATLAKLQRRTTTNAAPTGERITAKRPNDDAAAVANPRRPRVAVIVTQKDYLPLDYAAVRQALETRGAAVTVVSSEAGWATPKKSPDGRDPDVLAERGLDELRPGDFDALVFIPAGRPDFLAKSPLGDTVRQRLREQYEHGVCIATIQNSVAILADHGLLNGQRAAAQRWITTSEWFDHGGAIWDTDAAVVASGRDGRLLTANNFHEAENLVDLLLQTIERTRPR